MTLQVSLERPAYIQRIGKQLKDLLDIYDGLGSTVSQRDQLLESMRIIKRYYETLRTLFEGFSNQKLPPMDSIGSWMLSMKKTQHIRSTKPGWHPKQYRGGRGIATLSLVGPHLLVTHAPAQ